jgi:hypothetical protein
MSSFFFPMGANQSLRGKGLLFRRCAIRVPLDLCASGTLALPRPSHSVVSREKPSKRAKGAWAECRTEARIKEPAVEAIEARVQEAAIEAVFEAILEAVETPAEAAVEAGVEGSPRPGAKGGAEDPAVEAGSESAVEARMNPSKTPSHTLGVNLPGAPSTTTRAKAPTPRTKNRRSMAVLLSLKTWIRRWYCSPCS